MNELGKEIVALIDKLESSVFPGGSAGQIALSHLKRLLAGLENTEDPHALESEFAELEQFWASSVAWCSELSKDIEKIIIMHKELL